MRGHLYALNASTGKVTWTFAGTAGPGQPGHSTWKGNSWQLGGGDIWMAPAFDAKLGLLYVAVANPEPRVMGAQRAGADLYTNSLVALHASTGKIDWTFQSIHHDLWDYDNTMTPVIASVKYKTGVRTVVIYGSKSAWLYYLDAQTGKPAIGVHNEKVPQLASQATAKTQPIPAGQSLVPTCPQKTGVTQPIPDYTSGCEFTPYLHMPVIVTQAGLAATTGPRCRSIPSPGCCTSRPPSSTSLTPTGPRSTSRRSTSWRASSAGACSRGESQDEQDRLEGTDAVRPVQRRRGAEHRVRSAVRGLS